MSLVIDTSNYSRALPEESLPQDVQDLMVGISQLRLSEPISKKRAPLRPLNQVSSLIRKPQHSHKSARLRSVSLQKLAADHFQRIHSLVTPPKTKKSVKWAEKVGHRMTFKENMLFESKIDVVDESQNSAMKTKNELSLSEADALLELSKQKIDEWKLLAKELRPVGRNGVGERVNRHLTEKALSMRYTSQLVTGAQQG